MDEKDQIEAIEKLIREEKLEEAVDLCEKAMADFPTSFQIKITYGKILMDLTRYPDSERVLGDLLRSYPDNLNLLGEMGKLYFRCDQGERSLEYFNKILFLDPFNDTAKDYVEKIKAGDKDEPAVREDTVAEEDLDLDDEPPIREPSSPELLSPEPRDSVGPIISLDDMAPPKVEDATFDEPLDSPEPPEDTQVEPPAAAPEEAPVPPPPVEEAPAVPPEPVIEMAFAEPPSPAPEPLELDIDQPEPPAPVTEAAPPPAPEMPAEAETAPEEAEKDDFITESAAELYQKQGLYDEALTIYEKLYAVEKLEKYLTKIQQLKRKRVLDRQIQALNEFLRRIQQKGEELV